MSDIISNALSPIDHTPVKDGFNEWVDKVKQTADAAVASEAQQRDRADRAEKEANYFKAQNDILLQQQQKQDQLLMIAQLRNAELEAAMKALFTQLASALESLENGKFQETPIVKAGYGIDDMEHDLRQVIQKKSSP